MDNSWELTIVDGAPPVSAKMGLGNLVVGDIDGDGHQEIITGGDGAMLWYRPDTGDRGVAATGKYHVGLALADIDGDGRLEIACGRERDGEHRQHALVWYKPTPDLRGEWAMHVIDEHTMGGPHDVEFADVDGDGVGEIIATACYVGICIYKRPSDPTQPWRKHIVHEGNSAEGIAVGDLDGDGRTELVAGPYVFFQPERGAWSGPWRRTDYAPYHREMCRVAILDITGRGRGDIVCVDSEYFEGQLSWFENRLREDPARPWVEHKLERPLIYAHSLHCRRDGLAASIFLAEMAGGGWNAPYNYDARLLELTTTDGGKTWRRELLDQGQGTHQAVLHDIDNDGELEVVGKEWRIPRVQIWKRPAKPSPITGYRHRFIDRDKPDVAIDILAADVDGDGRQDVVCGRWWYRNPSWERHEIPGIYQVIQACDLDGDGRAELIATTPKPGNTGGYSGLCNELVWLKAIDPAAGRWEMHAIGKGIGDWPHGSCIAPLLPGGRPALVTAYHSAHSSPDGSEHYPDLFELPDDLTQPWPRRTLAPIRYGEQLTARDITGNGTLDLFAGPWWLENLGDGTFQPHRLVADESFYPARVATFDIAGNGRPDVVMGQEVMDYPNKFIDFSPLAWFECPPDPRSGPWPMHVIDRVRCAHSIGVADLDGDGKLEIVAGEHDPFNPYRSRCRLFVYKAAGPGGRAWKRYQLDDRFEHHDGAQIIELSPGRLGIISHAWQDKTYVHLWEPA